MKKIISGIFLFFTVQCFAQAPANDVCSGAISLGTLASPGPCGTGIKKGTVKSVAGTLTGATPENPYVTQGPCAGGTTMASPANDVWYSFVAPVGGPQATISVTGAAFTPSIAVWTGTCGNFSGMGCVKGTVGTATVTITGNMIPGQTYYIQVSGNTGQTGAFTLNANSFFDCSGCNNQSTLVTNPLPVNGMYNPGQTVQFCYHVDSYTQANTNWLHGVQVSFGSGWNAASLTTTAPAECSSEGGTWDYYPGGVTGAGAGVHFPAGFYFDSPNDGSFFGISLDGDPGNNYGDPCSGTIAAADWKFCITLTVANVCNPGADLSVTFNTSGDGESGIWTDNGCAVDPPTTFFAIQSCCPPTMTKVDELCNGGSTGSVTATAVVGAAGAQNPYTFTWAGPVTATTTVAAGTSNTMSNVPAGTYTVTLTDKNFCTTTATVTVTQPTALTATLTPTNATCSALGSITTARSGGTSPYTYAWAGPSGYTSTSQSPTGLSPGTYTLTLTDNNSCTFTVSTTVGQTGSITTSVNSPTYCTGGSATLTASGGTTFSWTPATGLSATTGATVTASPTVTTTYTVTGTTGTCTSSATSTVTVVGTPTAVVNSASYCTGGSATLTASGATTYAWSPATGLSATTGSTVTASPTVTTTYTVTGTAGTCTSTATSTVTVNPTPTVTVNSPTYCAGGSATLTATGATTYSWAPATGLSATTGSTVTASPTVTTTYTVTGTTGTCTSTATSTVTVSPIPTVTVNSPGICSGGSATLTATGATTYAWSPATGLSATTGASVTANPTVTTTYTVTGTTATCTSTATSTVTVGNLTVTVNSASYCNGGSATLTATGALTYSWNPSTGLSATTGATVTANPTVTTTYTVTGVSGTCTSTAVSTVTVISNPSVTVNSAAICIGSSATLTASGTTTYSWLPATGLSATTGSTVTANPTVTTTYTITGTVGTCTATNTSTVTVNPLPVITVTNTGPYCPGATIQLNATGGTGYAWTGPSSYTAAISNPTKPGAVAGDAGTYSVTVTDANGCVSSGTTTVVINSAFVPIISSNSPICVGATLNLTCTNGSSWSWSGPNGFTSLVQNPSITTVTLAAGGTYSITASDAAGCTGTATLPVTINPLPIVTVNSPTICVGDVANINAGGASTYSWTAGTSASTGAAVTATPTLTTTYTVTGTDANGCVNTAASTVTVNSLPNVTVNSPSVCPTFTATLNAGGASTYTWSAGTSPSTGATVTATPSVTTTYTVTGTDVNGCVNSATSTVTVNSGLVIDAGVDDTICNGATFTVTASGGPAGTNYTWNPGNLSGASQSQTASTTTTFTVSAVDANGCAGSDQVVITVPPVFTLTMGGFATSCNGVCDGQVVVLANPTTGPFASYQYLWSNGATTASVNGLCANTYSVVVADAAGCIATATTTVTEPTAVTASASNITNTTCNAVCNGSALITASGGSGTFTYSWVPAATGSNPNALCAGNYVCTVADGNGCSVPVNVTITQPTPITVSVTPVATICIGQTANLSSTAAGGNGGYVYTWTGGTTPTNTQNVTASPTVTASYTVSVTDVNSCTPATASVTVTVNPPLGVVASLDATICVGTTQNLGAMATGGNGVYTYTWATGTSPATGATVTATPTVTTTYTVTVNDGCGTPSASDNVVITVNPTPVLGITVTNPSGCAPVCSDFNASSNPPLATVTWAFNNGASATGSPATNVCFNDSGTYGATINITDVNGCHNTYTDTTLITVYPVPVAAFSFSPHDATEVNPVISFTDSTYNAQVSTWLWNFGNVEDSASALQNPVFTYGTTGTFDVSLTVTTAHGCTDNIVQPITIDPEFILYAPNAFTPNGDSLNDIWFPKGVGIDITHYELWIYDRWGNQIFTTNNWFKGWDGKVQGHDNLVEEDVYVWKIKLKTFKGDKKSYVGHITVVR